MSFKNFKKYNKNFVRQTETCVFCDGELDRVELENSNGKELFVRCENDGCEGYTIAEKKPKAKTTLNNLTMCISL